MHPKVRTALDLSKTGISGSNPIQDKNVCPHFFSLVLQVLEWHDSPLSESYCLFY
jgi:hypothetical protein